MKKPTLPGLVTVTLVLIAFSLGFFLGRNCSNSTVQLFLPEAMQTAPPESVPAETVQTEATEGIRFPVDLNTATKEELMALPGIGEVLAQRILAYRQEHGSFRAVEELLCVEGIGEKRLEELLEFITIGG